MKTTVAFLLAGLLAAGAVCRPLHAQRGPNPLITGKSIATPRYAINQPVGSLPMNLVLTPDGRFAISSDMGFRQSLWAIDTSTGKGVSRLDFPNSAPPKTNGLYYGLAAQDNGDGSATVYAAQGDNSSIAVVNVAADGTLTRTRTIQGAAGDFFAGLALDGRGNLYAAVNEFYTQGAPYDPTALQKPGALVVFNAATGAQLGRFNFATPPSLSNFPLAVAALADGSKVFVSSQRDGRVYVLNAATPATPTLTAALPSGSHPVALLLNRAQTRLFVANAHSDTVSVFNTADNSPAGTAALRPAGAQTLPGATPTGLALSPDERTLYVTLGDMNAIAVVDAASLALQGYLPAGWYPSAVAVNPANTKLLVANAKGTQTRNPNKVAAGANGENGTYVLNIIEGSVSTFPAPNASLLATFTQQVLANNGLPISNANPLAGIGLHAPGGNGIKHVIYIVKENRTYDQVLGDLKDGDGNPLGNGDPALTLFGESVTPNLHALARRFVVLDNFYDCGEASGDGWPWSTQAMANEYVIKNLPYNYSGRGRNYDFEGANNFYPTGGFPATDPNGAPISVLFPNGAPAIPDVAEAPGGHIWDDVLANIDLAGTGLTRRYRNYGFHYSLTQIGNNVIPDNYPASRGVQPPGHDLDGVSDFDFREFDVNYADSDAPAFHGCPYKEATYSNYTAAQITADKQPQPSRFSEFKKEFQQMLAADPSGNGVPAFLTVRFMSDHTNGATPGDFSPRAHVADNDYACGQFVDLISHSPIWNQTAIFIIEDDAQDGQDHVDAHRSTCYVISPFIKANSVDHTFYNTNSVLRTMELLLGLPPMNQYDAIAAPIAAPFGAAPGNGSPYAAILPDKAIICEINPALASLEPGSEQARLAELSAQMDFSHADALTGEQLLTFNEAIWKSVKGFDSPAPAARHALSRRQLLGLSGDDVSPGSAGDGDEDEDALKIGSETKERDVQ